MRAAFGQLSYPRQLSNVRGASLAIVSAFLVTAACTGGAPTGETYKIATDTSRSGAMHLARAEGVLQGQINSDGTACFWVGASTAMALSWPYGYSARANPLAVYDEAGNRVAAVGQKVTMGGGLMADSVRSITGCAGFTTYWGVGQVISATT
jgi:hypothetical protein